MRALFLLVAALAAVGADAATCPNRVSCENATVAQILAAWPVWSAKAKASCDSLKYAGHPHCAQLERLPGKGIPTVVYGVTDVASGGVWAQHGYSVARRPGVTPDSVLGSDQLQGPAWTKLQEYGDDRAGQPHACFFEHELCFSSPGGVGLWRGRFLRDCYYPADPLALNSSGWEEDPDTTACVGWDEGLAASLAPAEQPSNGKPPKKVGR